MYLCIKVIKENKMEDNNKHEMMSRFIKESVDYALDNGMKYFYIGFPDINDVRTGGIYIAKASCKKFSENVKGFYGRGYIIANDHWNKNDILVFLSKELKIPFYKMILQ